MKKNPQLLTKRFIMFSASSLYALAGLLVLNCSDAPLGPIKTSWVREADVNFDVTALTAAADGSIFVVGGEPGTILRWTDNGLVEDYSLGGYFSYFFDIAFAGDIGWAAGIYKADYRADYKTVLLRREGTSWTRYAATPPEAEGFFALALVSAEKFWVVADGDRVFFFNAGAWEGPYELSGLKGIGVAPGGVAYAWGLYGSIWTFDGTRWIREFPAVPGGLKISSVGTAAATASGIYFTGLLEGPAGIVYRAIIKRDLAPAGEGVYDLEFFAPPGPYAYGLTCVAFRSATAGVALGFQTHIACTSGLYYKGDLPPEVGTPVDVTWSPGGKYWMASKYNNCSLYSSDG